MAKRWKEMLREFEGVTTFLYPDLGSLPTVGVGHACRSPEHAVAVFKDPRAAADWQTIRISLRGQATRLYAELTTVRLTDEQVDALEETDIAETETRLRAACPDSDSWPVGVREAALDIEYNVKGGIHSFPKMLASIRAGDYAAAAAESRRPQLQAVRNQWTFDALNAGSISATAT